MRSPPDSPGMHFLRQRLRAGNLAVLASPGGHLMPTYPLHCSCDRCCKPDPSSPWEDTDHPDSDSTLAFCPQCGQQLEDNPIYDARR